MRIILRPYCQVPVNRTCAPFDRVTVPVNVWPDIALGVILVVAGKTMYAVASAVPEPPTLHVPDGVYDVSLPAQVIEIVATEALSVPELVRAT